MRSSQVAVENNFSKGLITESTAMAFPENAVVETTNCDFSPRGVVTRRLGVDYETNYSLVASSEPAGAKNEFLWETINNNSSITFLVQQISNFIYFFEVKEDGTSNHKKSFSVDMLSYKVSGWTDAQVRNEPCSFSSGFGFLYITNSYCEPITIDYNDTTDTITTTAIDLSIRDFEGVPDGLALNEQPLTLSDSHKYNLFNQGWNTTSTVSGVGSVDVLDYFFSLNAKYPSNAEAWWHHKDNTGYAPSSNVSAFQLAITEAPKGHYVFNAFNLDRSSIIAGVSSTSTTARPSTVTFFNGRVFYSGIKDKEYSSTIYFSQIVTSRDDVGKCYQNNDPISEGLSEVLANDGGVIKIAEAGIIHEVIASNNYIVVLASNGVWLVSGTSNEAFSPTNYQVTRVSDIGSLGSLSSCKVEGVPLWVNNEGIYTLQTPAGGEPAVVSLTKDSIQEFFNGIPRANLATVKSYYNSFEKRVMFLYRSAASASITDDYSYDSILVLDRVSGAFYTYYITDIEITINGLIACKGTDATGKLTTVFKFLTIGPLENGSSTNYMTYSQFFKETFVDWTVKRGGTSYESYFITGYRVRGELLKKFQSNYLMVLTDDQVNGSCLVQGVWDYTNNTSNSRFTSSQEVYRPDSTFNYHRAKVKIRGNGYSLQFKFKSNGNAPFKLIGWSTFESANNVP